MSDGARDDGTQAAVLLYDADCGFCTKAAAVATHLRLQTAVRPLQTQDLAAMGVSPERALREIPFVAADGSVSYGHRAIAAALRTSRTPLRSLGKALGLRILDPILGTTYLWVADHRHQFVGGTPACATPDRHNSS